MSGPLRPGDERAAATATKVELPGGGPAPRSPAPPASSTPPAAAPASERTRWRPIPELVMLQPPSSPVQESLKRLWATLSQGEYAKVKVLCVTSPIPGDGKTFVTSNLAITVALSSALRVLLVDADLRRPSVQGLLDPPPRRGVIGVLDGKLKLADAITRPEDGPIDILAAGGVAADPVHYLSGTGWERLIAELRTRYDYVVIDTPPVIPFADADIAARQADGVVLVVRSGNTPKKLYTEALDRIRAAPILGTVLNAAERTFLEPGGQHEKYYYSYYSKKRS